jgi:hypothetical protein
VFVRWKIKGETGSLVLLMKKQVRISILACFLLTMEDVVEERLDLGAWPHNSEKQRDLPEKMTGTWNEILF